MARKTEADDEKQEGLPDIPQAPKRKIIPRIEKKCLERDRLAGERTAIGDQIKEIDVNIQKDIDDEKLDLYTYKDAKGVLQDVLNERKLKKRKSSMNPKPKKGDE